MGLDSFCRVFTSLLGLLWAQHHLLNNSIKMVIKLYFQTPFIVLHYPNLCPFSSSIYTWQLHQPLPLMSWVTQFDSLCPLFLARNKNICSVKCFCKWLPQRPHGVTGVHMDPFLNDGLISVLRSDFSEKGKRHQLHVLHMHLKGCRSWLRFHPPNQTVAPRHAAPPLWTPLARCLYRPCTDNWRHRSSWDKAHETFLTFLECVANQEWLLMCAGFSNWR